MDIKISVILPIYNQEKYVQKCLDSIVSQTLKDIEIIAVNDGSTDGSLEILEKYRNKYDNIIILNQVNQGVGKARNNGINRANGKYMIFIDPDDFYPTSDCLEALYNSAEEMEALVCGGWRTENNNGRIAEDGFIGKDEIRDKHFIDMTDYKEIYGHQRYLFRTDLIRDNNIFFPNYKRFQDPPFTVNALLCAGRCLMIDKDVYEHRKGHQKVLFSEKVVKDVLCGERDIFKLASNNNLLNMYNFGLKDLVVDTPQFYKYAYSGNQEIDGIIEEINEIIKNWIGREDERLTKNAIIQTREHYKEIYNDFLEILSGDKSIILYGAGEYTSYIISDFKDKLSNVIGIAVTEYDINYKKIFTDISVKQIDEYSGYVENSIVLITTAPRYWKEIERTLNLFHFKDIKKINVPALMVWNSQ